MRRRHGEVIVDKVEFNDGTSYTIRLNKDKGEFFAKDPLSERPDSEYTDMLSNKDLPTLRQEIKNRHKKKAEANYQLKIVMENRTRWHHRGDEFSLDSFDFKLLAVWQVDEKKQLSLKPEFWDGKTPWVDNSPHWSSKPYGPGDQVRWIHGTPQGFGGSVVLEYTWERYQTLVKIREQIAQLKEKLTQFFDEEGLAARLDKLAGKQIALLPPAQEQVEEAAPVPKAKGKTKTRNGAGAG